MKAKLITWTDATFLLIKSSMIRYIPRPYYVRGKGKQHNRREKYYYDLYVVDMISRNQRW